MLKGNIGVYKIVKEKGLLNEGRKKEILDKGLFKVRLFFWIFIFKRVFLLIEGDGNFEVKLEIFMLFDFESEFLELILFKVRLLLRN